MRLFYLHDSQGAVEWLAKVDVDVRNPEHHNVPRFLNRILGIPSEWQSKLFSIFSSTLDNLIRQAKLEKSYDQGTVFVLFLCCYLLLDSVPVMRWAKMIKCICEVIEGGSLKRSNLQFVLPPFIPYYFISFHCRDYGGERIQSGDCGRLPSTRVA